MKFLMRPQGFFVMQTILTGKMLRHMLRGDVMSDRKIYPAIVHVCQGFPGTCIATEAFPQI